MLVLAVLVAAAVSGCAKKPVATTPVPPAPAPAPAETTPTPPPAPTPEPTPPAPTVTAGDLQTVYFAYDSFQLDDGARAALDANARLLREHAGLNVSVDGHCDERGSVEYNQALGQKRAEAVQQYLMDQGIAATRFRVISYGKERPAVEGSDESAWSRNRRVEFTAR
jgi:peptidoglycan-associated lipoprotein